MRKSKSMPLEKWIAEMKLQIVALRQIDLGYPQGNNEILPPKDLDLLRALSDRLQIDVPNSLADFYHHCGGLRLPDVWNGYFVFTLSATLKGIDRGNPTTLAKTVDSKIIPFGCDVGGNLFALNTTGTNQALFLRPGLIEHGVFEGAQNAIKVVGDDFDHFLERLLADTKAFVADPGNQDGWRYMDQL
jgi:hypothetical protein